MSDKYSSNKKKKKNDKNVKMLFSMVCLSIIALGMIVYFSNNSAKVENNPVNENQTLKIEETTEVQRSVTLKETEPETEATTESQTTTEPVSVEQDESNTPYKSYYEYPLGETVQKGYTEELVADETMGDYRAHTGVDFSGKEDDTVLSINKGKVINVYNDNMYGGVVEIDHGGMLVAKYCGLKTIGVTIGEYVELGDEIGTVGTVPIESVQGAHLHLETKLNGKFVNPLDVMGKTE